MDRDAFDALALPLLRSVRIRALEEKCLADTGKPCLPLAIPDLPWED